MSKVLRQQKSQFQDSHLGVQGKSDIGCSPRKEAQSILWGGEWYLLPKVASCVKLVLQVVLTKSIACFHWTCTYCLFFLVVQADLILNYHLLVRCSPILEL